MHCGHDHVNIPPPESRVSVVHQRATNSRHNLGANGWARNGHRVTFPLFDELALRELELTPLWLCSATP